MKAVTMRSYVGLLSLPMFLGFLLAAQQQYPSGNYGRMMVAANPVQNNHVNPQSGPAAQTASGQNQPYAPAYNRNNIPNQNNPGHVQPTPHPNHQPPQNQNPMVPFFKPKARCECYIATLESSETDDLLDLLLPFGTSRSLTTERTDTTCRELQNQCLQHCRIQRESCLMDGLRSVVPGSNPPVSYGSYVCKLAKEETRRPAGVFYALNAMYCKDEGFLDRLDDHFCCLNFDHPFVAGEQIRLFSPNCSTSLASCNGTDADQTMAPGNTTVEPPVPSFDNETTTATSPVSTISSLANSSSTVARIERQTSASTQPLPTTLSQNSSPASALTSVAPTTQTTTMTFTSTSPLTTFGAVSSTAAFETITPTSTLALNDSVTIFSATLSEDTTAFPAATGSFNITS